MVVGLSSFPSTESFCSFRWRGKKRRKLIVAASSKDLSHLHLFVPPNLHLTLVWAGDPRKVHSAYDTTISQSQDLLWH